MTEYNYVLCLTMLNSKKVVIPLCLIKAIITNYKKGTGIVIKKCLFKKIIIVKETEYEIETKLKSFNFKNKIICINDYTSFLFLKD